jgi:hypothetical protein
LRLEYLKIREKNVGFPVVYFPLSVFGPYFDGAVQFIHNLKDF